MTVYHASTSDLGLEVTFDSGGYYERITDGCPDQLIGPSGFCGFKRSDTPEISASKSPEASLFATSKNLANDLPTTHEAEPYRVHIYEITATPDVNISDTVGFDFALLEEVRFQHPAKDPIQGSKAYEIIVPGQVLADVELTYLPPSPNILSEWGETVKSELRDFLRTGTYPDDISLKHKIDRPNPEAFTL